MQAPIPDNLDFEKELGGLLPHRSPFVLVDELRCEGKGKAFGRFRVPEEHPLVSHNRLAAGALVEMIAQTAGAGAALARRVANLEMVVGYIGAIKDLNIFELPETGQLLEARTELLHEVLNALVIRGSVYEQDRLLATCELKIFQQS